jgi:hypothetical protein
MVDMDMTVKVVTGLENLEQPAKGFYPLMGQVWFIVNTPRRRVADKYVELTTVYRPV